MRIPAARIALGAGFVGYGVWAALNALTIVRTTADSALGTYWPALIVLWGLLEFAGGAVGRERPRLSWWPLLWAAAAALLLADNAHWIAATAHLVWTLIWAAVAVGIGIAIVTGGRAFVLVDRGCGDAPGFSALPYVRVRASAARRARHADASGWFGSVHVGGQGDGDGWELSDRVYRHGIGDFRLDLTRARLRDGETRLAVYGGVGEIQVLVPPDLPVHLTAEVRVGEIRLFGREASGIDRFLEFRSDGYDAAPRRLRLEMRIRLGDITVERVV